MMPSLLAILALMLRSTSLMLSLMSGALMALEAPASFLDSLRDVDGLYGLPPISVTEVFLARSFAKFTVR